MLILLCVSRYYHRGHAVIVGLDTLAGDDHAARQRMLRAHHHGLRSQDRFRNAVMILMVEGNMNWFTPGEINELFVAWDMYVLNARHNVFLYSYDQHKTPLGKKIHDGTFTDHAMKQNSMNMVRVMMQSDLIHLDAKIVSLDAEANKAKLFQQLGAFHLETRDPTDHVTQQVRTYLTGKDKSGSQKDDLVMTLMMGVFWARQSQNNEMVNLFVRSRGQELPQVVADVGTVVR